MPRVPATNRPIAAVASACAPRPVRAIALPSTAVITAPARRGVQKDRGSRSAVLRAVVDAGEHDEGRSRLQAVGDRQKERDGGGRPDARQHADRGAERDADRRPHEVGRRERYGEALDERG